MMHNALIMCMAVLCTIQLRVEAWALTQVPLSPGMVHGDSLHIRLAGKATGAITRAEWSVVAGPEIVGVPGAMIVEIEVSMPDSAGGETLLSCKGDQFLHNMRSQVAQLQDGTLFGVQVIVLYSVEGPKQRRRMPMAVFTIVD